MPMPTAMKNRPSSKPLNGSMSVSSSRRYSLSASSTPARKAPSAIDRPTDCISAAIATTSSSAAAVKISGVLLRAIQRSIGRSSSRPPSTMAAITPSARARLDPAVDALPSCAPPPSSGTSARIGIAAMSCSSATDSTPWPAVVPVRLRSFEHRQPDRGGRHRQAERRHQRQPPRRRRATRPPRTAVPLSRAAARVPQPKIGRRIAHRRRGSSSRPTRNSISTTPNSAKCSIDCGSLTRLRPNGPDRDARPPGSR